MNEAPHGFRRGRSVEPIHAVGPKRVEHGVGDGWKSGDRAGLAAALHAERVRRARNALEREVEGWQVVGAGHAVIHEGAGDELPAFRIIGGVLQ